MKILITITALVLFAPTLDVFGQRRRPRAQLKQRPAVEQKSKEIGATAIVMDETLSVLRMRPSLFSDSVQRMRRGRAVRVIGVAEADGVKFYRVTALPAGSGWVQPDALFGRFRVGDAERLARLIQASSGFDQIELGSKFFEMFPDSPLRPSIWLLYGDLLEEAAAKLSKDAAGRLDRREMAATGAPMHSYYLNFVMLDRYRKLGVLFVFDPATRAFHYDGACWRQIVTKFPASAEFAEAEKRLDSLKSKMEKK